VRSKGGGSLVRKLVSFRVHSWLCILRCFREGRNRLVEHNPWQLIFEEDRFLRRKRCRVVERCNREIDRVRIFAVFEKQMRAATRGERSNPIRIRNLARFTLCHDQVLARHRSPLHIRRTGASPAIDAMTIDQCRWQTLQHVSCPTANASTSELHNLFEPSLTTNLLGIERARSLARGSERTRL